MLNGRVYGRRRPYNKASTDPFANVRDTEPEFVEWGYGGMGSNKSNATSSMGSAWRAVQNGSNSSAFGNDEDDASGMAWVKKRKAAREKAKLETERAVSQPEDPDVESPQPTVSEEEVQDILPQSPEEDIPRPPIDTLPVAPAEQPHEEPKHITTAVNLPPRGGHKRDQSLGHRIQIPQVESPVKENPSFGVENFDMELVTGPEVKPGLPEPSPDSTSEDEDEEDSSTDEEDEDSDGYSEENAHSKTTLGAGVEKVSRHKDTPQSKTPNLPHSPLRSQLPTAGIEA